MLGICVILALKSHDYLAAEAVSQSASKLLNLKPLASHQSSPLKHSSRQASSPRPKVRDSPSTIEESFYDLDGLDDEDLAALVDKFGSSQKLDDEVSPHKTASSRRKSGRSIPWATSSQDL